MSTRLGLIAQLAAATLVAASVSAAPKKGKPIDAIWVHPGFSAMGVEKIAVLPVVTFDGSYEAQKVVEQAFGQVFRGTGQRWISPSNTQGQLRALAGGKDSILKAIHAKLLKADRVDSLEAPQLCAQLRADAVMSLRVDQWERQQLEWNQTGRPYTTVRVRAALVDSSGALLWSAAGTHKGEGSDRDPGSPVTGVTASGLDPKPISAQAGAPAYAEVVLPLFTRWSESFPAKTAPAPTAPASEAK